MTDYDAGCLVGEEPPIAYLLADAEEFAARDADTMPPWLEAQRRANASGRAAEALRDGEPHHCLPPEPPPARELYPVAALPPVMRRYVGDYARVMGCPVEYVAMPMLAAAAGAIGMSRALRLRDTWTVPPVIWGAVIGPSAAGKSPPMRAVIEPLMRRQRQEYRRHAESMQAHDAVVAEYEAAMHVWQRSRAGDAPVRPTPPVCVRHVIDDATMEAVGGVLAANPRGVLMARDEIGGWVLSMDAYRQGGDLQRWLTIHDAGSITVDRRHGVPPVLHIPRAAVSIIGGIQPGTMRRIATPERVEAGLLGRILLAAPDVQPVRWTDGDVLSAVTDAWAATVDALCDLRMAMDADGEPCPVILPLTPDAHTAWVAWHDGIAAEAAQCDEALGAALGKLREYAARLALIVALAADPSATDVDTSAMEAGITLARWHATEARRWYAACAMTPEERETLALLELIRRRGGRITARDLARGPHRYRPAGAAEAALESLIGAGLARWEVVGDGPGRPSAVCVLTATAWPPAATKTAETKKKMNNVAVASVATPTGVTI